MCVNKIPTAKEFMSKNMGVTTSPISGLQTYLKDDVERALVEFAKLHVEAALKAACEKARIIDDPNSYCGNTGSEYPPDQIVSKDSILNAYPLDNIK